MFREGEAELASGDEASAASDEDRWVRCGGCGANVAPERARIAVGGAHEHEFMNPAGLRFRLGCFATAPGCVPDGPRETVWSWFPGHAWQIELCRACGAHLGWSFHAPSGATFWGLVVDRLA